jgi:integrase
LNILRRLGLPDLFKGLRLKGKVEKEPSPYDTKFIQDRLLADASARLNEEARHFIYVIADTGRRPSEVVNLNRQTIHLNARIPYVSVLPRWSEAKD